MRSLIGRFALISVFVVLLVSTSYWQFGSPKVGIDDANIFFVYAKHLSQGHGFVYNIGGERVEGFTSLLWVLILSVLFRFTPNIEMPVLLLNVLLLSIGITIITKYLDDTFRTQTQKSKFRLLSSYSVVFLFLIAVSPYYVTWMTITLKEEGFWSFLLIIATIMLLKLPTLPRASVQFSVVIGLLLLTRPESMLWCLVYMALAWIAVFKEHGMKDANKFSRLPFVTYSLTLVILTVFRLWYFGYPLPNTFYAKVSPSLRYNLAEGQKYLFDYAQSEIIIQLLLVLLVVFLLMSVRDLIQLFWGRYGRADGTQTGRKRLEVLPFLCAVSLCFPVLNGGDHFGGFRFFQPIYPLLALNCLLFWSYFLAGKSLILRYSKRIPSVSRVIIVVMLLVSISVNQYIHWKDLGEHSALQWEFFLAESGRHIGRLMTYMFSGLDSPPAVGLVIVGGIKFVYEGPVIDLMGLNNTTMGHSEGSRKGFKGHAAFEKDAFYELKPDIVWDFFGDSKCYNDLQVLYEQNDFPNSWLNGALKGLLSDREFNKQYRYTQLKRQNSSNNICFKGFFQQDFLSRISSQRIHDLQFLEHNQQQTPL